jgi:hypothetical protein
MKLDYNLEISDYKKAMNEQFRKRYFFAIAMYIPFALLVSSIAFPKNFTWNKFWITSLALFVFFILLMIISDYVKHKQFVKALNIKPTLYGKKTFEFDENGVRQYSENVMPNSFKWQEIKKVSNTENYTFITLRNKTSIIIPNKNIEYTKRLTEALRKYSI